MSPAVFTPYFLLYHHKEEQIIFGAAYNQMVEFDDVKEGNAGVFLPFGTYKVSLFADILSTVGYSEKQIGISNLFFIYSQDIMDIIGGGNLRLLSKDYSFEGDPALQRSVSRATFDLYAGVVWDKLASYRLSAIVFGESLNNPDFGSIARDPLYASQGIVLAGKAYTKWLNPFVQVVYAAGNTSVRVAAEHSIVTLGYGSGKDTKIFDLSFNFHSLTFFIGSEYMPFDNKNYAGILLKL